MDRRSETYGKLKSMYESLRKKYPDASPEEIKEMCKRKLAGKK